MQVARGSLPCRSSGWELLAGSGPFRPARLLRSLAWRTWRCWNGLPRAARNWTDWKNSWSSSWTRCGPRGRLVWVSAVKPGRTSEITACRHNKLTAHLRAAGLGAIADQGFVGLDDSGRDADPAVITGYKAARNKPLTRGQKLSNMALAAVRAPVEHGFAHLKNWRVLGKVRTDPEWATELCGPCWS